MTSNDFIEIAKEHPPIKDTMQCVNRELVNKEVEIYANKPSIKLLLHFAGERILKILLDILTQLIKQKLKLN